MNLYLQDYDKIREEKLLTVENIFEDLKIVEEAIKAPYKIKKTARLARDDTQVGLSSPQLKMIKKLDCKVDLH